MIPRPDKVARMISADTLSARELAALLHFHADAGVDWLLEENPVDRFAEFEAMRAARASARQVPAGRQPVPQGSGGPGRAASTEARTERPVPQQPPQPQVAIPDEQAVAMARRTAAAAGSLAELREAVSGFQGCNLRNSARNMVFAEGDAASGIMVIGAMPNGDDDRDGIPFSGTQGQMLDRMLAGIGLDRRTVLVTNVIPWRPPGNRIPSPREVEICRPFIERQIALAAPRHILVLGNFTARFFFGGNDTIHHMRGEWREIAVEGVSIAAIATLHPQDLLSAPSSKRLAWQDLLAFQAAIR